MYGFTIVYNNLNRFEINSKHRLSFSSPKTKQTHSFFYQQGTKFYNDQLFKETEELIIGIHGVILNLQQLKNEYAVANLLDLVLQLYQNDSKTFYQMFNGDFSGFVFNKQTEELICFTNQVATHKLFYSTIKNSTIISCELSTIAEYRKQNNFSNALNIDSAYFLLTYGGMFENNTLIKDVNRIHAGQYLLIRDEKAIVKTYYDFNEVNANETNSTKAIEQLNELFNESIKLEYEKDKEYNYEHLATLSGGLDSRMNVMVANQLGYSTNNFCFSQSNYDDQKIAQQISTDLKNTFQFIPLDNAEYLTQIDENLPIYDGQIFYLASAHYNYSMNQLNTKKSGLIHTGQIGDGVLGGFVSKPAPNYFSTILSQRLAQKLPEIDTKKYNSEETFKLYNRVFNVTVAGSYVTQQHDTFLVSPFLNPDFIKLCLSLSPSLKQDGKIYINWINQKHPEVAKYKWEKTGFKPNAMWKIKFSRFSQKIKKTYHKSLNRLDKTSMNPYDYWYQNNSAIPHFFQVHFDMYIRLIENLELKKDVTSLFLHGNTIEKSMVLTLLEAIHKYQLKN